MSEDMFRTVGRRTEKRGADCSQLLVGRRAVHTFLLRFTVQESNGVCCVDRDSFQEKREEESGARSERESKNSKSELDFESELQQARGFLAGCI